LNELNNQGSKRVQFSFTVAILNDDIFSFNVTKVSQPLAECLAPTRGISRIAGSGHISYSRDFLRLLRLGYDCNSKQRDYKQD
jgi:hypothetical protein